MRCWLILLVGAIGIPAITAGEIQHSKSHDAEQARLLSEEKLERAAAALDACCQRMLELQAAIHRGTQKLHRIIESHPDKKPRPEDEQAALKLSEISKESVKEIAKALDIVTETSALAFPQIFELVRDDMERVQRRLEMNDVGTATQNLELDIIDTLREMIKALKKG